MFHLSSCPACTSNGISILHSCQDHLVSMQYFDIYRCGNCGFTFTNDYPGPGEAGHYYESPDYIPHTDSDKSLFDKLYRAARNVMLNRKSRLVSRSCGKNSGRILDIGSGTGHFLNKMKMSGWNVTGIEINEKARSYSFSHFEIEVFAPEALISLPDQEFDCITLWHVAEHLHDLTDYFKEIRRLVKPGGTVIVALPNCNSYDSRHYGKFWAAWDVPRHLWHFSPVTFREFAEKNDFRLCSATALPLDVFYISILSERNMNHKVHLIRGAIKGLYFSFLTLFNKMKGSSLVYVLGSSVNQ